MRLSIAFIAASMLLLAACASNPGTREGTHASRGESAPIAVAAEPAIATEPATDPIPEVKPEPEVTRPVIEQPVPAPSTAAEPPAKPVSSAKPRSPRPVPKQPVPVSPPATASEQAPETAREIESSAELTRIEGKVDLVAGAAQSLAANEMGQVVVYFVPDKATSTVKPGRYLIYTHNKNFEPESLVIPLGSTISFPNQDEILHNVFSVTPKSSFDLGVYGEGKSAEYTFKKSGLVLINCNVHHAMQANVLVVDTPYMVSPDKEGHFVLDKLPVGGGKLMIWHPRANVQEQGLRLPANGPIVLQLVLSKPRFVEHMNKERKPY